MTTDTEVLITNAVNLIKNGKDNVVTISKITPSHLTYDIRRIENHWVMNGFISEEDTQYLEHIYVSSHDYLKTHVYMIGGWHKFKSYRYASHNMHTQKRLKHAKLRYSQYPYTQSR